MLLCSFLIISGCTQQNPSSDQTKPPTQMTLQQILEKALLIESMYYELETSTTMSSGTILQNSTMKIWEKMPYLKEEVLTTAGNITMNLTIIKRPEGLYVYNSIQHRYILSPGSAVPQDSTTETVKDLLNNQTITNLGTETIDGNQATVIQYTPNQRGNSSIMKMWIWNEKGIPLKAVLTTTKEETITMIFLYKNYSFVDIPDSTFDIL
jgi:outer membrane lipoprotein-sorting protein